MTPDPVETALRESEARYRSALQAGRMGSWETDFTAGTRTWSQEGMALFGLDLPEGRGQVGGDDDEYAAALHPDDRHLAADFHALADRQDSFIAEYRIVRPDGTTLWLSGRGLVMSRRPDGKAERLVSIMADVSERKLAEESLRIERERLALALQAGQMGVFDLDIVNDVLWWSPQTYDVFGVTPETFTPTRERVIGLIHPDDRQGFIQGRLQALARRRAVRPRVPLPAAGRPHRLDRPPRPGRVRRRRPAAAQLRRHAWTSPSASWPSRRCARPTAGRTTSSRRWRTSCAIRWRRSATPSSCCASAATTIRSSVWCRDVIDRQVTQMARLLDDLLDVSRMTRGQLALRRERLALPAVIEHALEIAQPLIDEAGTRSRVSLPAEPLHVDGDLTRLAQVFSNLLINAAKYTPAGGRLGLAVEAVGEEVEVRVSDNGIGISAEQMPRLFEMFAQGDSLTDRAQGGLGIGLSLARGLVEMHGGRISAHSDGLGQGSEFVVRLPLARTAAAGGARPAPATESVGAGRAAAGCWWPTTCATAPTAWRC